jgi:hypothetical protein
MDRIHPRNWGPPEHQKLDGGAHPTSTTAKLTHSLFEAFQKNTAKLHPKAFDLRPHGLYFRYVRILFLNTVKLWAGLFACQTFLPLIEITYQG